MVCALEIDSRQLAWRCPGQLPMVLPLEPGWEEVKDETTGRVYYWNTQTDATSWERPCKAAPPPPPQPPPPPSGAGAESYSTSAIFTSEELGGDVVAWLQKHEVILSPGCPPPITTFEAARLPPSIYAEIAKAGFPSPTPIQAASWAPALQGRDVIGIAKTGSGKTLGFLAPAFVRILAERRNVRPRRPTKPASLFSGFLVFLASSGPPWATPVPPLRRYTRATGPPSAEPCGLVTPTPAALADVCRLIPQFPPPLLSHV